MDAAPARLAADERWEARVDGTRVVFGTGALGALADEIEALGGRRVLVVTDPGLRAAGHVETAESVLRSAGVRFETFDGVAPNPTSRHVAAGVEAARRADADLIVALGGGSPMDCAKAVNLLLTNGGRMADWRGFRPTPRPMLPSIGVPTTAGTGSDGQSYALIADEATQLKMACGAPGAKFKSVIVDPSLARTAPRDVVAVSGMDALTHAVESYVCTRANPLSRLYAREAWGLLVTEFPTVLEHAGDLDAWGRMLWGAHLAGASIEQSMLGAAHACANPLTARFGVVHGAAVGLMLPAVIEYNEAAVGPAYAELGTAQGATQLVDRIRALRRAAGLPERLRDCAVPRDALDTMADEAAQQWTAGFNPRRVGRDELRELYEACW